MDQWVEELSEIMPNSTISPTLDTSFMGNKTAKITSSTTVHEWLKFRDKN